MTTRIDNKGNPDLAILFAIRDVNLHAYMQKYPFLTGPDESTNSECFRVLQEGINIRRPKIKVAAHWVSAEDLIDESVIRGRLSEALKYFEEASNHRSLIYSIFNWKMCFVPIETKKILAIGCGAGIELAAIRARLPDAELHAIDWSDGLSDEVVARTNVKFTCGNFLQLVSQSNETYDVIFANHVAEHLYNPDEALAMLRKRLNPNGRLVLGLPMDGNNQAAFYREILALAEDPYRIRRTNLFLLNVGHPWKTNESDLTETLTGVGFSQVTIYRRSSRPNYIHPGDSDRVLLDRDRWTYLHRLSCEQIRRACDSLFRAHPPLAVLRGMGAVERRLPWGTNRCVSKTSPEALVVARNNADN